MIFLSAVPWPDFKIDFRPQFGAIAIASNKVYGFVMVMNVGLSRHAHNAGPGSESIYDIAGEAVEHIGPRRKHHRLAHLVDGQFYDAFPEFALPVRGFGRHPIRQRIGERYPIQECT